MTPFDILLLQPCDDFIWRLRTIMTPTPLHPATHPEWGSHIHLHIRTRMAYSMAARAG